MQINDELNDIWLFTICVKLKTENIYSALFEHFKTSRTTNCSPEVYPPPNLAPKVLKFEIRVVK